MSLGGIYHLNSVRDFDYLAYNAMKDFPGIIVAAAGNDGRSTDVDKNFPSGFGSDVLVSGEAIIDNEIVLTGSVTIPGLENVISVAASDSQDQLAYFSNYGQSVDIAAPGVDIYSTFPTSELVSGEAGMITYASGWIRQATAHTGTWSTRTKMNVDGTAIYNPTVLWGDTRTPYVSGESAYIQKTFANPNKDIAAIKITAWCDTSNMESFDDPYSRIDVLVSTGGLFTRKNSIDEF
jgi:subtilisin family serine protease